MHTKKSFPLLVFLVVLIGSALLTACGEGGTKPITSIDVDMTDHKFTPNDFTVPAGAEITINLTNSGQQPHEFRILVFGAKVNEDIDKDRKSTRYWSTALLPGEKKSFTITPPPEAGSYVIKCSSRGHTEAGMVGTLHVK